MDRLRELFVEERPQFRLFGSLSLVILGCVGVLTIVRPQVFRPYFGGLDPIATLLGIVFLGTSLVTLVLARDWFVVYEPGPIRQRIPLAILLPTLLAVGMALVDFVAVLPADINVSVPYSLLFYPTMGFVVEVLFHLLPLAVAFLAVPSLAKEPDRSLRLWVVLVVIALLEPLFQLQAGFSGGVPRWATMYVGANVFAINLAQLYLFRRYDFVTMFAFRLVYYAHWHVVWGTIRLQVLF
ncbi:MULTISPECIES: hypothetical protein [Haloferax]|uniref:CPBP family intramembrane metalloprotease n=1 Tax=Haloferax marinum TaxID=2666143 RepID=A0A6A8G701_9EURY|nr:MULTISPECIES: hypothetical protein [Haloferax]KAB1197500.1 hypothetical protein Hfx1150_08210 [Haloferax sp. CBA1150]MRW96545.1 hypothetical protein [Haloferax marinum]